MLGGGGTRAPVALAMGLAWAMLASCGDDDSLSARPGAPEEAVAPPVTRASTDSISAARSAYRSALYAYNSRDASGYFGVFAERIDCFHGQTDVSREVVQRRRAEMKGEVHSIRLEPAFTRPDHIVFVDRGIWVGGDHYDPHDFGVHEKLIVMELRDARWRVTSETSVANPRCVATEHLSIQPPAGRFAECKEQSAACPRACDRLCEAQAGGGMSCAECIPSCAYALILCFDLENVSPQAEDLSYTVNL